MFHYVKDGDYKRALQACERVRHPIGAMFRLGIRNRATDPKELEAMMEGEGEERIQRLERFLGALIVIIGVEPMLGFSAPSSGSSRPSWPGSWREPTSR